MLRNWIEAADEEDLIVLTSLRLAGRKQAKRLSRRHEELLYERLRISKEIINIWRSSRLRKADRSSR